jgi:hypothetical protein
LAVLRILGGRGLHTDVVRKRVASLALQAYAVRCPVVAVGIDGGAPTASEVVAGRTADAVAVVVDETVWIGRNIA